MSKYGRQDRRWLATNSTAWRKLRWRILERDLHTCQVCGSPASVVDHRDGKAAAPEDYRDSNLQSLCERCHSVKTALENGSFGRKPGLARQQGCDDRGIPLDRDHHWRKA